MKNTVYIKNHRTGAGRWIYGGYIRAWKQMGYEVKLFDDIFFIGNDAKFIMTTEVDLNNGLQIIKNVERAFVFVQPFRFPNPWGMHPNWKTSIKEDDAVMINQISSIKKWTFVNNVTSTDYKPWDDIHYIPLAFDDIGYTLFDIEIEKQFDVCFVGGWADNGYNEKQIRIREYLEKIQRSKLRCGFFVNAGLTHEQENFVISSTKIAINIHDEYQVRLGYDLNERTFKSLALSGILVSDSVKEMENLFSKIKTAKTPGEMLDFINFYMNANNDELLLERMKNRRNILDNHTYTKRIEEFLKL